MRGPEVFARIARRYDTLNRVLSLGRDRSWRRRAIAYLPPGRVLDLGGGTGAANPDLGDRQIVALDPAPGMLALNPAQRRVVAYGESLPFEDGAFDGVFSAYVFRNLSSVPGTLQEIHRVLRPGGVAAIVDLTRPLGRVARAVNRAGTAVVVPTVGMLAGARREYTYLHRSLDSLPPPEQMFSGGPMRVEALWRMGLSGFVYGVVLRKE
ncbi:MAG: class I SAM-dependent methyltransferase [Actinobacteria bacterium]|nr:class I SAM-dependent methyltransferase [Actinomycetota bacterium]